ncbi:MAG: hypothetical protein JNM89_00635 [Hyphomicrobiaceae bacterium]|nr:hypothetical protein [Hyphomicrobiaceae bacterium]
MGRTDARTDSRNAVNAKASVGAGTTVAAVAAAPKSAEAAKTPPEQATVAALGPAGPRAELAPSTTPARDSAGSEPGNPAWQSTNLTVTSLVAMGRIAEAREMLFQAHPETDPDAAWALARTFDPRYVARISGSDAAPDVEQATKWYRTWHALALEKGRISGDVSVERILRGMN